MAPAPRRAAAAAAAAALCALVGGAAPAAAHYLWARVDAGAQDACPRAATACATLAFSEVAGALSDETMLRQVAITAPLSAGAAPAGERQRARASEGGEDGNPALEALALALVPEPGHAGYAVLEAPLDQADGDALAALGAFSFGLYPLPEHAKDPPLLRYHYSAARPDSEGSWQYADKALAGAELALSLRPSAECGCGCGSASVSFNGAPLAGAHVQVFSANGSAVYSNSTGDDGTVALPGGTLERGAVSFGMVSHIEQLSENKTWGKNETYGAVAHYATASVDVLAAPVPAPPPAPAPAPRPSKAHRGAAHAVVATLVSLAVGGAMGVGGTLLYQRQHKRGGAASVPLLGDDELQDVELGSGGSDVAARTRNFLAHAMRTRRETVVPVEQGQSDGGGDTAE